MPPDTAEKRHSLPLQACPDRLTVKATPARPGWVVVNPSASTYFCPRLYSVFTINVPLAVRFATISIGTRKAESPEYGRFDRDLQ